MGHGDYARTMRVAVLLAIAACAFAHQTEPELEIDAPEGMGGVSLLQESVGADINYRITFKTESQGNANQRKLYTSADSFKIEVKGDKGTTGAVDLVDHPSQTKFGSVWKPTPGEVQKAFKKGDVGQVSMVKITSTGTDSWTPKFVKVNTNDAKTGLGSGVYYVEVGTSINKDRAFEAYTKPDATKGQKPMTKCQAQFCEKRMDKKLFKYEAWLAKWRAADDEENEDDRIADWSHEYE